VSISAKTWEFTPSFSAPLAKGDTVRFILSSTEDTHGFALVDSEGHELISIDEMEGGAPAVERTVVLQASGTYYYYCTLWGCGGWYLGHSGMVGDFEVAEP
jgi:plastocyanin